MNQQEIKDEFRMIISHALLGSDTSDVSEETWNFVFDECTKYAIRLSSGKVYTRHLNSNMALCLLALYRHGINEFVKVEDFLLQNGYPRCGDFSYLTHYGFLEKLIANREDGSKRNGYYKITGRGLLFAENKTYVPEKFIICNGKLLGFEGKNISIRQALGKKFNYNELMENYLVKSIIPSGAKVSNEKILFPNENY